MEFYWLDGWKPAFIFYWDRIVKMGGLTIGPFVFLKEKYREEKSLSTIGLLEHELTHVRQFYDPRKWFWGKLRWEVEAYKAQLEWVPDRIDTFAWYIATRYGLDITQEAALRLLQE